MKVASAWPTMAMVFRDACRRPINSTSKEAQRRNRKAMIEMMLERNLTMSRTVWLRSTISDFFDNRSFEPAQA